MPFLATVALATTGYALFRHYRREEISAENSLDADNQELFAPDSEEAEINHYFAVSTLSLGLTIGGALFPPLTVASIPFNLYTTVPVIRKSYVYWVDERRVNGAMLESALVLCALSTRHFLSASGIDWVYYFGRKVKSQLRLDADKLIREMAESRNVWVDCDGMEIEMPLHTIQTGDIVILTKDSFFPYSGRVVQGAGTINTYITSQNTDPITVEVGTTFPPYAIVISGRIYLEVIK